MSMSQQGMVKLGSEMRKLTVKKMVEWEKAASETMTIEKQGSSEMMTKE